MTKSSEQASSSPSIRGTISSPLNVRSSTLFSRGREPDIPPLSTRDESHARRHTDLGSISSVTSSQSTGSRATDKKSDSATSSAVDQSRPTKAIDKRAERLVEFAKRRTKSGSGSRDGLWYDLSSESHSCHTLLEENLVTSRRLSINRSESMHLASSDSEECEIIESWCLFLYSLIHHSSWVNNCTPFAMGPIFFDSCMRQCALCAVRYARYSILCCTMISKRGICTCGSIMSTEPVQSCIMTYSMLWVVVGTNTH